MYTKLSMKELEELGFEFVSGIYRWDTKPYADLALWQLMEHPIFCLKSTLERISGNPPENFAELYELRHAKENKPRYESREGEFALTEEDGYPKKWGWKYFPLPNCAYPRSDEIELPYDEEQIPKRDLKKISEIISTIEPLKANRYCL